ncbi:hypothetical protein [Streptomyces sp. NPDC059076]|uniref:hypothetical protein n=1 Tax=unclassified Streptomyces TaxID=2593676 RepID=UPI00368DCA46
MLLSTVGAGDQGRGFVRFVEEVQRGTAVARHGCAGTRGEKQHGLRVKDGGWRVASVGFVKGEGGAGEELGGVGCLPERRMVMATMRAAAAMTWGSPLARAEVSAGPRWPPTPWGSGV